MEVYFVTLAFIGADVLTGLLRAWYNGNISSTILRKGLFHKVSEIITLFGAGAIEYGVQYVELGINVPVLAMVAGYICIMELISVLENLSEMNPALHKLFEPYFKKLNKKEDENGDSKGN